MFRSSDDEWQSFDTRCPVGVGLRHAHFREAASGTAALDFLEVHTENYFAEGGPAVEWLERISEHYPLSFHGTAMGLGSAAGIDPVYLHRLKRVVEHFNPVFLSDHASFSWSTRAGKSVHMGDLLPLPFTSQSLSVLSKNVDAVQQKLGRKLLVENIVAYIEITGSSMTEPEFLTRLTDATGCGLLVDLNNLLVNAINLGEARPLRYAKHWLAQLPEGVVGEIHLAGYTPVAEGELIVDDHSRPVSQRCWDLYAFALQRFPRVATLIEWDNDLPSWEQLTEQANIARLKSAGNAPAKVG